MRQSTALNLSNTPSAGAVGPVCIQSSNPCKVNILSYSPSIRNSTKSLAPKHFAKYKVCIINGNYINVQISNRQTVSKTGPTI